MTEASSKTGKQTRTIALALDGYTDLPPGKIANVVTYLEREPPETAMPPSPGFAIRDVEQPSVAWYRDLYRRVGENWLWFSMAVMPDEKVAAILAAPTTAVLAYERDGIAMGLAELDFAKPGEVEIVMFGVVPEATGTGAARALMDAALNHTMRPGIARVWLHTCTFDHPAAVHFYRRRGFRAYKFAIEVSDDPRLTGHLPETAGRHVALIDSASTAPGGSV
jgi:ribosomal protein S18 acetylase RimI-like enzyme